MQNRMVRLTHLPAFRMLLPFLCGILIGLYSRYSAPILLLPCLLLLFVIAFRYKPKFHALQFQQWQGLLLYSLLLLSGWCYAWLRVPTNRPDHYSHFLSEDAQITLRLVETPEPKGKLYRTEAAVEEIMLGADTISVSGKLLVYIRPDSNNFRIPDYGDWIATPMQLQVPRKATNPGTFDFQRYLLRQGITHTLYLTPDEISYSGNNTAHPFLRWTRSLRDYLTAAITNAIDDEGAEAIALALLIGNRSLLDDDITDTFSSTGTMHILAVSGLHVGIIFLFFDKLLSLFPILVRHRYSKPVALMLIIWTYAILTGLSPSIFRAAIMFSFLSLGRPAGKHTNSFNILAASAFLLLIIDPMMVWQVGFQLSFSAILGILCFQPYLAKLWYPSYAIPRYVWSIMTVSIAAQIGTAPLSVYYFHQFPMYFLLSNIIAIPMSFITMCSGVLFCMTSALPAVGTLTGILLELLLLFMHKSLSLISNIPGAVVGHMYWPMGITVGVYVCLLILYMWLKGKRHFQLYLLQACVTVLLVVSGIQMLSDKSRPRLFIYDSRAATTIGYRYGNHAYILSDDTSSITETFADQYAPSLQRRWTGTPVVHRLDTLRHHPCIEIGGQHIFFAQKVGKDLPDCQPDYLVMDGGTIPIYDLLEHYSNTTFILGSRCSRKQAAYFQTLLEESGNHFYSIKESSAADLLLLQNQHLSYGLQGR